MNTDRFTPGIWLPGGRGDPRSSQGEDAGRVLRRACQPDRNDSTCQLLPALPGDATVSGKPAERRSREAPRKRRTGSEGGLTDPVTVTYRKQIAKTWPHRSRCSNQNAAALISRATPAKQSSVYLPAGQTIRTRKRLQIAVQFLMFTTPSTLCPSPQILNGCKTLKIVKY